MQDRVRRHEKITVHFRRQVQKWLAREADEGVLGAALLEGTGEDEGQQETLEIDGGFMAIGHTPQTKFLRTSPVAQQVSLDEEGYIHTRMSNPEVFTTGVAQGWGPVSGLSRTTLPGLFAAGDVVDRRYRQAITAAGMGCQSALDVEEYLQMLGDDSSSVEATP
eukprot:scaffold91_cov254-Pinguiococcus_pyrenoidosus.AAC.39